jgi:hypothetical protein
MRRPNWTIIALLAGVLAVVLLIVYFATNRGANPDRLTENAVSEARPAQTAERRCASNTTYDLIKRELFRRAAQVRGSDQAAYDKLAGYAVVRMDNPVMESEDSNTGAVNCSGSLSLDLPPGVAVAGGRRTLLADVDYAVDASGNVSLTNADAIITPLATLTRAAQVAPAAPTETNQIAPVEGNVVVPLTPVPPAPPAPPQPPRPVGARPGFDCAQAHTRGEVLVCSDAGLAALDRNMAAQYGRSIAVASPQQRDILRQTRDRFLAYRDRCPDRRCIGDAYAGRMREIRDIMEGRWRPR